MDTIRELTNHRVNGLNEALRVFVLDKPGSGNACHEYIMLVPFQAGEDRPIPRKTDEYYVYDINGQTLSYWPSLGVANIDDVLQFAVQHIDFQNGPIKESGFNGVTHEALLAILIDRMEGFQGGKYKCHDNQMALDALQTARLWLFKRTMDRMARNVEGTMVL